MRHHADSEKLGETCMIDWHWDVCYIASGSCIPIHPLLSHKGPSKFHSSFHFRRTSTCIYIWKSNRKPQMPHNHNPPLCLPSPSLKPTHLYYHRFMSVRKLVLVLIDLLLFKTPCCSCAVCSPAKACHTHIYWRDSASHLLNWVTSSTRKTSCIF